MKFHEITGSGPEIPDSVTNRPDFWQICCAAAQCFIITWLVETVSLNQACKAIFFHGGGRLFGQDLVRFLWYDNFTFWLCARKFVVRLAFPFVQYQIKSCSFRF